MPLYEMTWRSISQLTCSCGRWYATLSDLVLIIPSQRNVPLIQTLEALKIVTKYVPSSKTTWLCGFQLSILLVSPSSGCWISPRTVTHPWPRSKFSRRKDGIFCDCMQWQVLAHPSCYCQTGQGPRNIVLRSASTNMTEGDALLPRQSNGRLN
jgi:hypothetical protein